MRAWVRAAAALTRKGRDIRAHGARMLQKSPHGVQNVLVVLQLFVLPSFPPSFLQKI